MLDNLLGGVSCNGYISGPPSQWTVRGKDGG